MSFIMGDGSWCTITTRLCLFLEVSNNLCMDEELDLKKIEINLMFDDETS